MRTGLDDPRRARARSGRSSRRTGSPAPAQAGPQGAPPTVPPASAPVRPQVQQTPLEQRQSVTTQAAPPTAPTPIPSFDSQQQQPFPVPTMSQGFPRPPQMQQGSRSQFGTTNFGTGPATLRNIIGQNTVPQNVAMGAPMNQSSLPRPGGQSQQQQPQQQHRGSRGGRGGFGYQGQPPQPP